MSTNRILAEHQWIETERLVLRPFTIADTAAMFAYMSDPQAMRFSPPVRETEAEVAEMLANYFIKEPLGKYAIVWRETGEMIGDITLRLHEPFRKTELGYSLNRQFWGQGIMPEVLEAILFLCFEELSLKRVDAGCEPENTQSARVLEKIGMQREGLLRNFIVFEGQSRDILQFSMTDFEWQQRRSERR